MRPIVPVVTLAMAVVAGCAMQAATSPPTRPTSPGAASSAPGPVELVVYGAASLEEALVAVRTAYEAATPGTRLTIATDSSATLRTQIEQGAPADLFLSADERNPQALVDGGLADGEAVVFAGNALAITVPLDNPAEIANPADLATPGVKIVAAGDEVPITGYAERVLSNLASLAGYPPDFVAAYAANVVSREENVKAVLAKIELGEADAAVVYATDARSSTGVRTVEIPVGANVAARYAGVVVKGAPHAAEAHALLDWLTGPTGTGILTSFGFEAAS